MELNSPSAPDIPEAVLDDQVRHEVKITHYPIRRIGGLRFTSMGPT
jgi:hypothetical protein